MGYWVCCQYRPFSFARWTGRCRASMPERARARTSIKREHGERLSKLRPRQASVSTSRAAGRCSPPRHRSRHPIKATYGHSSRRSACLCPSTRMRLLCPFRLGAAKNATRPIRSSPIRAGEEDEESRAAPTRTRTCILCPVTPPWPYLIRYCLTSSDSKRYLWLAM